MRNFWIAAIALAAAALASAAPASANSLPAAYVNSVLDTCSPASCNITGESTGSAYTSLSTFGDHYTVTYLTQQDAVATAVAMTPHMESVSAGALNGLGGGSANNASVSAYGTQKISTTVNGLSFENTYVVYQFEVIGPSSSPAVEPVTIRLTASGSVSAATSGAGDFADGNDAYVDAQLLIGVPGTTVLNANAQASYEYSSAGGCSQCFNDNGATVSEYGVTVSGPTAGVTTSTATGTVGATSGYSGWFSLSKAPLALETGVIYNVDLNTEAGGGGSSEAFSAAIDPLFTAPAGYELEFSPGITNGVPETSTWAMLLLGFAGLGWAAHRRARPHRADALATLS